MLDASLVTEPLAAEDFHWLLDSLTQALGVDHDKRLSRQASPPPHDVAALMNALTTRGVRCGVREISPASLADLPLPAVVFRRPDRGAAAATDAALAQARLVPAVAVRREDGQIVVITREAAQPRSLPPAQFMADHMPQVLMAARTPELGHGGGDDDAHAAKRFGFSWFVPQLLRHKSIWRDVLLASICIQAIALALPLTTQVVIDKVVIHQTYNTLWVIAAALALFVIFNALLTWARQYLVLHTGNRVDALLGSRVFGHLLALPVGYFERRPTGTVIARLQGVETIREFLTGAAITLCLDLPCLVIFLAFMFFYSWQLALIALGFVLVIALISALLTPALRARLDEQFLQGARNQAFVTEHVAGIATVKALQMEPQLNARYGDLIAGYLQRAFRTRHLANGFNTTIGALEQAQNAVILVVGALMVMAGDGFTIGMLVAFQMFAARVSQPMLKLAGLYQELQNAHVAMRRLADLMDAPAEHYRLLAGRGLDGPGRIEVRALSFRYSVQHPYVLRDLSLCLAAGQLTAIMGPSGCGKSTLAKLIMGQYPPTEGAIHFDGVNINDLAVNELRGVIGVVPQETLLFTGTVLENVRHGAPDADFEHVVAACRVAEIHDTIEALPDGYQTSLGEQGIGLSGGQRQRIAIARALLKRPKILIFDEATSNLDAPTAERFAATINRLRGNATLIFIAHQLPGGLAVDRVVDLGGIEASGDAGTRPR
ncbi:MAG: peptidase domain-containing ABC transporter [Burkholderiales bacterium]